jgi:hypothetical protein
MKIILLIFIFALSILFSCNGQTKKEEKTVTNTIHKQEKGKPEEVIKVNRYYDEKGTLVSFDSTYTSYYESSKVNEKLMDSLVKVFKKSSFIEQFPSMNDKYFKNLFLTDSLINNDFFHEDFFRKRFELNKRYMERMMQQMDSVKNEFFKLNSNQKSTTKINR